MSILHLVALSAGLAWSQAREPALIPEALREQARNLAGPGAVLQELPAPPPAQEPRAPMISESIEFAIEYRQKGYQLVDFQGDVSLMVYTKEVARAITRIILGSGRIPEDKGHHLYEELNPVVAPPPSSLPREEDVPSMNIPEEEKERLMVEIRNSKLVIEGRRNPVRVWHMTRMFTQVIAEEAARGIPPRYGKPHRWSTDFAWHYGSLARYSPYTRFSKILLALSSGITNRFMTTGREKPLILYILGRPDQSVTIAEIFRHSYRLNGGDVYLTLLAIENVLAEYWRTDNRENRAVTRKLALVTNQFQGRGDKFGTWYHFFGIMLYAYVTDEATARAAAKTESIGSHVLSRGEVETQEDFMNEQGAVLGAKLKEVVLYRKNREYVPNGTDYTDPKNYLDLTEDFRDRMEVALSRDLTAALTPEGVVRIKSLGRGYRDCTVELIPDFGKGLHSEYLIPVEGVDIPTGQEVAAYRFLRKPTAVRGFLSCQEGRSGVIAAAQR